MNSSGSAHPRISIVAAVSRNGCVGKNNTLPWSLPADLKRFKEITYGAPIIMGRKTYDSIGRLLPGRKNIIVTRDTTKMVPGATLVKSIDEAIEAGKPAADIYIIGGSEIWKQSLGLVDRMYITEIDLDIQDGDTFFPEWPSVKSEPVVIRGRLTQFRETKREEMTAQQPTFRFLIFDRITVNVK